MPNLHGSVKEIRVQVPQSLNSRQHCLVCAQPLDAPPSSTLLCTETECISYTNARAQLATTMDKIIHDHAPVVITGHGSQACVLVSLDDWESMEETAYLMSSPANAARLNGAIQALETARARSAVILASSSVRDLVLRAPRGADYVHWQESRTLEGHCAQPVQWHRQTRTAQAPMAGPLLAPDRPALSPRLSCHDRGNFGRPRGVSLLTAWAASPPRSP